LFDHQPRHLKASLHFFSPPIRPTALDMHLDFASGHPTEPTFLASELSHCSSECSSPDLRGNHVQYHRKHDQPKRCPETPVNRSILDDEGTNNEAKTD
jgi:hypothetical protein